MKRLRLVLSRMLIVVMAVSQLGAASIPAYAATDDSADPAIADQTVTEVTSETETADIEDPADGTEVSSEELSLEEQETTESEDQTEETADSVEETQDEITEAEDKAGKPEMLGFEATEMPVTLYIDDTTTGEGTENVTLENLSGDKWSYDPDENVLTLNGFNGSYIECDKSLTIKLIGENKVTIPGDSTAETVEAIRQTESNAVLTIEAEEDASLEIACDNEQDKHIRLMDARDIVVNGGTLKLNAKTTGYGSLHGTTYKLTMNNDSKLQVTMESSYDIYAFNILDYNSSSDSSIGLKTNNVSSNAACLAMNELLAKGKGKLSISAIGGNELCVRGTMEVAEDAGKVTLTGKVGVSSVNSNNIKIAGNKAITNHTVTGYNWAGKNEGSYHYLTDLSGEYITDAVIDTVTDQPITVMGSYEIPALKVGVYYDVDYSEYMLTTTRGGKLPYRYSVKESAPLPAGLEILGSSGEIRGTPTEICGSGTAVIVVSDDDGHSVNVDVPYGAVTEKDRYICVNGTQINIKSNAFGTGWTYSADTKTLSLSGYNGGPITSDDLKELTIRLDGENKVTIPADSEEDSPAGIRMTENGHVLTIEAEEDASLEIACDNEQDKHIRLMDARDIVVNGGTLKLNAKTTGYGDLHGTTYKLTMNNDSKLQVTMESSYNIYAFNILDYNSSSDSSIGLKTNNVSSNADCLAMNELLAKGKGKLSISAIGGNELCVRGNMKVAEEAGRITLNGRVGIGSADSSHLDIAGNKAVTNHSTGYNWAGKNEGGYHYLTDLSGEYITDAVIDTDADQVLAVMGTYTIPTLKTGVTYYSDVKDWFYGRTRGGKTPYEYSISTVAPLPAGLEIYSSTGRIYGTPTEICDGGTAVIVVSDSDGHSVDVNVPYGGVTVSSPVESVSLDASSYTLLPGEEKQITATVLPANASITDVTFTADDSDIAYVKLGSTQKTGNTTVAVLAAGKTGKTILTANTREGNKSATATVLVKEPTPQAAFELTADGLILKGLDSEANYNIGIKGSEEVPVTKTSDVKGTISLDAEYLGKTITVVKVNEDTDLNSAEQELTLSVTMPTEIPVNVAVPRAGDAPATLADVRDGSPVSPYYTIESAGITPYVTAYEEGVKYTLTVTLKTVGALQFDEGTKIILNGAELETSPTLTDGNTELLFTYEFPAAGDNIAVDRIVLDKEEYIVTEGERLYYTATVSPANADNKAYVAAIADEDIATLEGSYIKPGKAGSTTLTVRTEEGNKTDTAVVFVRYAAPSVVWKKDRLTGFLPEGIYGITIGGEDVEVPEISEDGEMLIPDAWYNKTLKIVRKHAVTEKCDSEEVTVNIGEKPVVKSDGMYARFKDDIDKFTYTGSKIKPEVEVYNNGELLKEGRDYTLSYSGNVKVAYDNAGLVKAGGKVTVKGKGNLTGSKTLAFTIEPKSLGDGSANPAAGIRTAAINIVKGSKATAPVITYGSYKLTAKDYKITDPMNGKSYNEATTTTLNVEGKGNFKDSVLLTVHVVEKKSDLKKLGASVDSKTVVYYNPYYDEHDNAVKMKEEIVKAVKVYDSADKNKTPLTPGTDYQINFPEDIFSAGPKTVVILGLGSYSGSVSKKVTVKPLVVKEANDNGVVAVNYESISEKNYPYAAGGVALGDALKVTYKDKDNHEFTLKEGRDYKVSYSNNKVVSKTGKPAEYSVTFIGNYKGTPAFKNTKGSKPYTFVIAHASVADGYGSVTDGFAIEVPDVAYTGKAGTYYSTPVVTYNGVTLPSSNYTVKYYKSWGFEEETGEITKRNKLELADDENEKSIQVRITAKGNYSGTIVEYYKVIRTGKKSDTEVFDMSKARVTIYDKNYDPAKKKNKKLSSIPYNGKARKVSDKDTDGKAYGTVVVEYKIDGKYVELNEGTDYELVYLNNINKGKAVIVVKGLNEVNDGKAYAGNKRTTFKISASSLKTFLKEVIS